MKKAFFLCLLAIVSMWEKPVRFVLGFEAQENLAAFCFTFSFKHCKVLPPHIFFAANLTGLGN